MNGHRMLVMAKQSGNHVMNEGIKEEILTVPKRIGTNSKEMGLNRLLGTKTQ